MELCAYPFVEIRIIDIISSFETVGVCIFNSSSIIPFAQLIVTCNCFFCLADTAVSIANNLLNRIISSRIYFFKGEFNLHRQSAGIVDSKLLNIHRIRIIALIVLCSIQSCCHLRNCRVLLHRTHVLEVQLCSIRCIVIGNTDVQDAGLKVCVDLLGVGEPSHGSASHEGENNQDCYTGHCQFSLCAHFCFLLIEYIWVYGPSRSRDNPRGQNVDNVLWVRVSACKCPGAPTFWHGQYLHTAVVSCGSRLPHKLLSHRFHRKPSAMLMACEFPPENLIFLLEHRPAHLFSRGKRYTRPRSLPLK